MSPRGWIVCGAIVGALGVAIGAFGAHGLKTHLEAAGDDVDAVRMLSTFETGVRYQMYHAPVLMLIGLLLARRRPSPMLQVAGYCVLTGVVIFSGLLYALVLSGMKILGAIVPIGGLLLIAGWTLLAIAAWRETAKPGD